jgi:hypothetical protein
MDMLLSPGGVLLSMDVLLSPGGVPVSAGGIVLSVVMLVSLVVPLSLGGLPPSSPQPIAARERERKRIESRRRVMKSTSVLRSFSTRATSFSRRRGLEARFR